MWISTANTDWALGHDKAQILHLLGESAVVCVQEAKNVPLHDMMPLTWRTTQADADTPAEKGSAVIWRQALRTSPGFKRVVGVNPGGVRMLTRYIVSKDIEGYRIFSCHFPPSRYFWLQPIMMHRLRAELRHTPKTMRWIVGMDANMPIRRAARRLGGVAYGKGIVGFVVQPNVHVTAAKIDHFPVQNKFSDHPAIRIFVK